jgi:hypothetical protein
MVSNNLHSLLKKDSNEKNISYDTFKDPFILYGYGVVAFFRLLRTMIMIFAFISIFLAVP